MYKLKLKKKIIGKCLNLYNVNIMFYRTQESLTFLKNLLAFVNLKHSVAL